MILSLISRRQLVFFFAQFHPNKSAEAKAAVSFHFRASESPSAPDSDKNRFGRYWNLHCSSSQSGQKESSFVYWVESLCK
jgi:hypothetical protein